MKATYWQRGEALDYKNTTTSVIAAGTVVKLGTTRIGVVGDPINPSEVGSVHVCGVYEITKKASEAITLGTAVFYTDDGISATGTVAAGYAVADAAADDATVYVKLQG